MVQIDDRALPGADTTATHWRWRRWFDDSLVELIELADFYGTYWLIKIALINTYKFVKSIEYWQIPNNIKIAASFTAKWKTKLILAFWSPCLSLRSAIKLKSCAILALSGRFCKWLEASFEHMWFFQFMMHIWLIGTGWFVFKGFQGSTHIYTHIHWGDALVQMGGTCYTIWRATGGAVRLARRLYFQLWKLERGRLCCGSGRCA